MMFKNAVGENTTNFNFIKKNFLPNCISKFVKNCASSYNFVNKFRL